MTRLLVLSDTQIGATTVDLADQQAVLEQAVALAIDNDVQAVLHAGDVFEGPLVTPEQLRMFLDATAPLRDNEIPLAVIRGNGRHDSAVREVHALDVLREIDGITVSDRPEQLMAGGCWVTTLPWVHPGRLLAQFDGEVDHDHANEEMARLLVRIAADLLAAAPERPRVLLAHWAISGSKLPSGLAADEMREPVLPWADLDALGYDLIVAGHIHEPQRLDNPDLGDKTVGIVPGSPQQLNFGEHGEHGVWLVTLPAAGVIATHAEFVPLVSRRFVTVDYATDEPMPAAVEGGYVRIRYEATEEEALSYNHDEMRRHFLAAAAHQVRIEPTIIRERRVRAADIGDTHDAPLAALTAYCEAEGVTDGLRDRMVQTLRGWQ